MFEELRPHLVELRKRLFISIISIFVLFFVAFAFRHYLLDLIKAPLIYALPDFSKDLTFTQLTEALFASIKLSLFAALIMALPIIFTQIWLFIAPGLYKNEKKLILPFVFFATFMFVLGALFCYFFVVPMAFKFLISFGLEAELKPLINLGSYIGLFIKFMLGFGLSFELPVFAMFLAKIGLIDDDFLKKHFRIAVVLIFVFAAIMTPPDILSQLLMAIPLCLLYLLSILLIKFNKPKNK